MKLANTPRLALLGMLFAGAAFACPVCGLSATEQGQSAYAYMSLIMSFLPLVVMGSIIGYFVYRNRSS